MVVLLLTTGAEFAADVEGVPLITVSLLEPTETKFVVTGNEFPILAASVEEYGVELMVLAIRL